MINTARGGIVNEIDLTNFLQDNPNCHACVDVFEEEPYTGEFVNLPNITLSSHMAASTKESRKCMEETAMKEVIRFKDGQPMLFEVFRNA